MTTLTIKPNQKPDKETLRRLSELKDEDIVYDDDCPEMTPLCIWKGGKDMLEKTSKNIIMGNVQLIDYCKRNGISLEKLQECNIERMGNTYLFALSKREIELSMDNDIDTQPDVVLTMDVTADDFTFSSTQWTYLAKA